MTGRRRLPPPRGGILLSCLLFLVVLAALVALAWMTLLPNLVAAWVRERTGFEFKAESLMANPFTGTLVARGVMLSNPPTFPTPEFLRVNEFSCQADAWSLLTDKPVFERVTLDIAQVALVKRADGRTNAEVFRAYLAAPDGRPAPGSTAPRKRFVIRELRARFDRLLVADYSGPHPARREFAVQIDRTFKNVSDGSQLLLPSSLDQLFALGGAVGDLLPADIGRVLEEAMRTGTGLLRQIPDSIRPLGGFSDTLEESKKP
ncbi:MAG: hypothetical protein IT582_03485 [Opitutaceae bacterium]|nr:hypothetical protein [Opitutaceae bacterium]